jgi:vancomycin resistance protein YoaR
MAVFLGRALNLRPIDVPVQPDVIGSFTTYHPACRYPCRVTNIQLIADTVDDTVVQPGEIFSVNELVGQRTRTKGYVAAGAIIGGEIVCCDHPANIGGGTSQFATTLYNAAFFAGLEDIYHRPHSIWFSRYPMGREATLGYPGLDVKFRNNTGYALIIDTSHTSTSITVKIIGINDIKSVKSYRTGTATTSGGGYVKIRQLITFYDGSTENHYWSHRYNPLK